VQWLKEKLYPSLSENFFWMFSLQRETERENNQGWKIIFSGQRDVLINNNAE